MTILEIIPPPKGRDPGRVEKALDRGVRPTTTSFFDNSNQLLDVAAGDDVGLPVAP